MILRKVLPLIAALAILTAGYASAAQIALEPIAEPVVTETIDYGDHKDQSLLVQFDPDGPPRAAMIQISSGGWNSSRINKAKEIPELYKNLGMAFVIISHRSLHDFRHPAQVEDVQAAIKYIKQNAKKWNIDPDRLTTTGRSSGGHLAMWLAFHPDSPDLKCVIQRSGPSNFDPEFLKTINPNIGKLPLFTTLFGEQAASDKKTMSKLLKDFSPVTHMSADDPPVLFAAGYTAPSEETPPNPNYGKHHHLFAVHGHERYKAVGGVSHLAISMGKGGHGGSGADNAEEMFLRKYLLDQDVELNIAEFREPVAAKSPR